MTAAGGKIKLEWSSFQTNTGEQFSHLRTSGDFVDVTLVCEDQTNFEAHRVVLAGGSSFFANILSGDQVSVVSIDNRNGCRMTPPPLFFGGGGGDSL